MGKSGKGESAMCGRYLFTQEDDDDLLDIANVLNETYGADAWHPGDMTP